MDVRGRQRREAPETKSNIAGTIILQGLRLEVEVHDIREGADIYTWTITAYLETKICIQWSLMCDA